MRMRSPGWAGCREPRGRAGPQGSGSPRLWEAPCESLSGARGAGRLQARGEGFARSAHPRASRRGANQGQGARGPRVRARTVHLWQPRRHREPSGCRPGGSLAAVRNLPGLDPPLLQLPGFTFPDVLRPALAGELPPASTPSSLPRLDTEEREGDPRQLHASAPAASARPWFPFPRTNDPASLSLLAGCLGPSENVPLLPNASTAPYRTGRATGCHTLTYYTFDPQTPAECKLLKGKGPIILLFIFPAPILIIRCSVHILKRNELWVFLEACSE